MGNVGRVLRRDAKRLLKAPAAWIVAIALMVLPSLYTWFNVAGFWNPYENTSALTVCIVNEDEGAVSEQVGALDLGDQIEGQLHENDQMNWQFVSRDDARARLEAGQAYAAFVIPSDFSANVASLVTGDFKTPKIEYYVNEKVGPVAPKITDAGANALDTTINESFVSTVSETVAGIVDEAIDSSLTKAGAVKSNALARLTEARDKVRDARGKLDSLSLAADNMRAEARQAQSKLDGAGQQVDELVQMLDDISLLAGDANALLIDFSLKAGSALDGATGTVLSASSKANAAVSKQLQAILEAQGQVDAALARIEASQREARELISMLERLEDQLPASVDKTRLDDAIARAKAVDGVLEQHILGLQGLSADLGECVEQTGAAVDTADAAVQQTVDSANGFRTVVRGEALPGFSQALTALAKATGELSADIADQKSLVGQASAAIDGLVDTVDTAQEAIGKTAEKLNSLEGGINGVIVDVTALSVSNALSALTDGANIDAAAVADFMMSPTQLVTEQLYPLNAYGSAMAPLFMNLTLWIGVFMLMVIMRLEVDDEGIERLTFAQRYFGRFLFLAPIACIQAAVCCTGCLVLGVQTVNVAAFYITAIVASLSYLALQFTLSTLFQHIGKGACLILVFVQIPGASGLYPTEMMPDFFHVVYPLFPFSYGINAIRETIGGFYGTTWISCLGVLAGYLVVSVLAGSLLRPYVSNLNRLFAREIAESDMIVGESVELPARRWRVSQVVQALNEREEFRADVQRRINSFMGLYPLLFALALFFGMVVPLISTPIMLTLGVDKVIVLTTWLAWLVIVIAFVVVVEFVRDSLVHQVSLEQMDVDEMRKLFRHRDAFTRVKPLDL